MGEKAFPLRGRCPSSQTGADEVGSNRLKNTSSVAVATASPQGEAMRAEKSLTKGKGLGERLIAVGRSYYTFDVSCEEHRAMPACEKPPARRADVFFPVILRGAKDPP